MNGVIKFHKPNGPAFNEGEIWFGQGGSIKCVITGRRKFGEGKFDWMISYSYPNCPDHPGSEKDAWCFQVRYTHQADLEL